MELIPESRGPEPIRIWGEFYPEHKAIKFDLTDIQTRTDAGTYLL